jgi:hypothetical protein
MVIHIYQRVIILELKAQTARFGLGGECIFIRFFN